MPLTFAVEEGQSVTLSDGTEISFHVNPADTSEVVLHVVSANDDPAGTHIFTFKRNGSLTNTQFVERPDPDAADKTVAPATSDQSPLAGYKSVDDDAVRGEPTKPAE